MIITVVSKADFAGYAPSRAAAILRIYDPVEDYAEDQAGLETAGWGDVLALSFWDMGVQGLKPAEALVARLLGRWRSLCLSLGAKLSGMDPDIPWRPFLAADARDIAGFADALPDRGIRHLMVVCGNGRARSYTIARWLSRRLGATLADSHGWQRESPAIAGVLKRVPSARSARPATAPTWMEPAE